MISKKTLRILSGVFGILGMILVITIAVPIAANEAEARQKYPDLLSPIPRAGRYGLSGDLLIGGEKTPEVLAEKSTSSDVDYTKVANWFPQSVGGRQFASQDSVTFYTITIPELKIDSATVAIGGEDLTDTIIQYPGTALPGKTGNSVLFGHSILPYFFNPKEYVSIFSTIDKLDRGDEIFVDYDGISYRYVVKETFKVKPTDVYILDQNEDGEYLSLVTCWPMGHPSKPERLVVRAELAPRFN